MEEVYYHIDNAHSLINKGWDDSHHSEISHRLQNRKVCGMALLEAF
mgnify:CR=1 FL=1